MYLSSTHMHVSFICTSHSTKVQYIGYIYLCIHIHATLLTAEFACASTGVHVCTQKTRVFY